MATKRDIERMADSLRAGGFSVLVHYLHESSKLPYHISVTDTKSTKTVEIRPLSIAAAVASLQGIKDGVWLAKGQPGNYPA